MRGFHPTYLPWHEVLDVAAVVVLAHPAAHVRVAGEVQVLHQHRSRPRRHGQGHGAGRGDDELHVVLRGEPRDVPLQDHPPVAPRLIRRHCFASIQSLPGRGLEQRKYWGGPRAAGSRPDFNGVCDAAVLRRLRLAAHVFCVCCGWIWMHLGVLKEGIGVRGQAAWKRSQSLPVCRLSKRCIYMGPAGQPGWHSTTSIWFG